MQIETQNHLEKAKAMIHKPDHWTQLCKARDKDGMIVGLDDPNRQSICLISSLQLTRQNPKEYDRTMFDLAEVIDSDNKDSYTTIANFNDTNPHSEVMDLLDKAINQPHPAPRKDFIMTPEQWTLKPPEDESIYCYNCDDYTPHWIHNTQDEEMIAVGCRQIICDTCKDGE